MDVVTRRSATSEFSGSPYREIVFQHMDPGHPACVPSFLCWVLEKMENYKALCSLKGRVSFRFINVIFPRNLVPSFSSGKQ